MTENEILRRFPNASRAFIEANLSNEGTPCSIHQSSLIADAFEQMHRPEKNHQVQDQIKMDVILTDQTLGLTSREKRRRERISASQKGKVVSEETRKSISFSKLGGVVRDETRKKISATLKANQRAMDQITNLGKSNKGKPSSELQKEVASRCNSGKNAPMFRYSHGTQTTQRYKSGRREDIGIFVRSAWEANYARFLNFLIKNGEIKAWEYEPDTFMFESIKRGTRSYTPDFKVFQNDGSFIYHEVKGWMSPTSITKLKRMKKYYPEVRVDVIDKHRYRDISKTVSKMIPHWEFPIKKNNG